MSDKPGILDRAADWIGEKIDKATTPNVPEPEPENAWLLTNTPTPAPDPKKKQTTIMMFTIPADMNKDGKIDPNEGQQYNEFDFYYIYYTYQLQVIDKKLVIAKQVGERYRLRVEMIDKMIADKKTEYSLRVEAFQDLEKEYNYYKELYDRGLGKEFYPGDAKERALKAKMASIASQISSLPGYDEFVYSGNLVDIDNPSKGIQNFKDIRILRSKYQTKMSRNEDETSKLEDRKSANKFYLDLANQRRNWYCS
ncbi:MAG: hypothetical protein WC285_03055 [Candidatus Gracilibacteria bacterium]|jgi:hypothetical protein